MLGKDIPTLKTEWEKLNAEYDAYIQSFLDTPRKTFTAEETAKMKKMQEDLFTIETALFTLIENEMKPADDAEQPESEESSDE